MISFSPSEEQQMIINTVHEFALNEMRKLYRECDFRAICIALVKHITTLYQPTSKE